MAFFNEWLGARALTPVAARWFGAALSTNGGQPDSDGITAVFAPYTSDTGTGPYQATLTRTRVDFFGNIIASTSPIVTYDTGAPFSVVGDIVSPANEDVFFTAATAGAPSGTSDIEVQRYDLFGSALGCPTTLVSGVSGFQQLRVGSAATYGHKYFVAYSTFDATANAEAIHLLTYSSDNRLIGSETLDSFSTGNDKADPFGFGSLDTSFPVNSSVYLAGYEVNGAFGVRYQVVDEYGALQGSAEFVAPLYPTDSTNRFVGDWAWTRLEGGTVPGVRLAVVMPFSYDDSTGSHSGLDVRIIDPRTSTAVDDTVVFAQQADVRVSLARMPGGGLVVGYLKNGKVHLRDYDGTGALAARTSFALPAGASNLSVASLGDGRILLEYAQPQAGGSQLMYDVYDTRQTGVTLSNYGDQYAGLAGTIFNDTFLITGFSHPDTIVGAGGTDFIVTDTAAGSGTVVADLKDGIVTKGGQLDARIFGIQGVTAGSGPTVVMGLTTCTDIINGGRGDLTVYNEGATDDIQGGTGSNTVVGGSGTSVFTSGGGNDTMWGGSGDNYMKAGTTAGSSDVFRGTGGRDYVYGGAGRTSLYGGSGTETFTAGSGRNILTGSTQAAGVDILHGGAGIDNFYAGIGTNLLYEGTGTDVFAGNSGTDFIYGGSGRSFVYGGSGTDVVTTGAGNQYVKAGTGLTYVNETAADQTAGRYDLIDNFDGGTATNLYLAAADRGVTSFVAEKGGVAVLTTVQGGVAEIFASDTSVASVQAHTHFTL